MGLPKLVRDRIPELIKLNESKNPVTRILADEEYITELLRKLREEAQEVGESEAGEQRLEELADVMELVKTLAALDNSTLDDIETIRAKKAEERGGFEKKILLEEIKN